MEYLNPAGRVSSVQPKKIELKISVNPKRETQLFIKTIGQEASVVTVGTWKDKTFTLSKEIGQMDLQQVVMSILNYEGGINCTENDQSLLIKAFFEAGVSLNGTDQNKKTFLHHAARLGNLELMRVLLDREGIDIEAKDESGTTALSYAVGQGNKAIVELLIRKGAKKDTQNSDGITPLQICIELGHAHLVRDLINPALINAVNRDGYTPLHLATFKQNAEIIKILLESGADPNKSEKFGDNYYPLHYAVLLPSTEIAKLLLDGGAKVDVAYGEGYQAIHLAVSNVHTLDFLELLVARGANVNAKGDLTPLQWAESRGVETLVRTLLRLGADPNLITANGTALNFSTRANPGDLYSEETKILTEECVRRKMLSLRFGISGYSKVSQDSTSKNELYLEVYLSSWGKEMAEKNMDNFSIEGDDKEKKLFEAVWSAVISAFHETSPKDFDKATSEEQAKIVSQYLTRLNEGKPIIVPTGWKGHIIYMVFIKTTEGMIVIECNRGERANVAEGGFSVYQINDPYQVNDRTLSRLLMANDHAFTRNFVQGFNKIDHVGLKDQKSGSCSFTSAKTAVLATTYMLLKYKGLDNQASLAKARTLYRSWTQHDRANTINEILDEYENNPSPLYRRDYALLFSVLSKMNISPPVNPEYLHARQRLLNFLIKEAPDPWEVNHQVDASYRSPLSYAVHSKQKDLLELMLKKGCDINATDPGQWTLLQRAISEGDKEMVSFLIKHGAKLTADQGSDPPIYLAMDLNRLDVAVYLLAKMKKQGIDLNLPNASGTPLMHQAAKLNAREIMNFLINHGCDIEARDLEGFTVFQSAIWAGQKEAVDYLIEKGVSIKQDPENGILPLHLAINGDQTDIAIRLADYMKQNNISLNEKDAYHQYTPIELASYNKNTRLLGHLLKAGVTWDERSQAMSMRAVLSDSNKRENLTKADEYINFLKYLFDEQEITPHSDDHIGFRPIDICLEVNAPFPIIKYVIDRIKASGKNVNDQDVLGKTIVDHAKEYNRFDICNYLESV